MQKFEQLAHIRQLGLPTPRFREVGYEQYLEGKIQVRGLRYPVAVRSSYQDEDGEEKSHAGAYVTVLNVAEQGLSEALASAFEAYPEPKGNRVIVQEMVQADFSGVLFAYENSVWKMELIEGLGEGLVSGHKQPKTILLPRFTQTDARLASFLNFWPGLGPDYKNLNQALIKLSFLAGKLLRSLQPKHGLDIEFAVKGRKIYLLQARPITTAGDAEEVLTSANHKEILPPRPSRLMTSIICSAGPQLFEYYLDLDSSLSRRSFLLPAAGMPWINLSALLDVMVHWGLPTSLIARSVGAADPYQIKARPWRIIQKLPLFLKMLLKQQQVKRNIRHWLQHTPAKLAWRKEERKIFWNENSEEAFQLWRRDFSKLYVQLVTHMQTLTGSMSGPVNLLNRMGWLAPLSAALKKKSKTTDYLEAFRQLQAGLLGRSAFLAQFGHRGFYESDLGQKRFEEYSDQEWQQFRSLPPESNYPDHTKKQKPPIFAFFFGWVISLIHLREELRHETMRWFFEFRRELQENFQLDLPEGATVWDFHWQDLEKNFQFAKKGSEVVYEKQSGWDMDTFLANKQGRRLPLSILANLDENQAGSQSIGIYPGKVKGQVWRVHSADISRLNKPPFAHTILVADALDPGWAPFFTQVDGVIAHIGGLLSHASIVLRESGIPSITQLPVEMELHTGEWIEMDGKTGEVKRL